MHNMVNSVLMWQMISYKRIDLHILYSRMRIVLDESDDMPELSLKQLNSGNMHSGNKVYVEHSYGLMLLVVSLLDPSLSMTTWK